DPEPEVRVFRVATKGDIEITDGQSNTINFGKPHQGTAGTTRTFRVTNAGDAALSLGAIKLPKHYKLLDGLPASLAAGKSNTFKVQLTTGTLGTFAGTIKITTNDSDENPFDIPITGKVTAARTRSTRF